MQRGSNEGGREKKGTKEGGGGGLCQVPEAAGGTWRTQLEHSPHPSALSVNSLQLHDYYKCSPDT